MHGNGRHFSALVQQAEGMVSVQAGCTVTEARVKLDERAKVLGRTLEDVAAKVVGRRIWFR
jgi:hypothetical protein